MELHKIIDVCLCRQRKDTLPPMTMLELITMVVFNRSQGMWLLQSDTFQVERITKLAV